MNPENKTQKAEDAYCEAQDKSFEAHADLQAEKKRLIAEFLNKPATKAKLKKLQEKADKASLECRRTSRLLNKAFEAEEVR
jgi:hypothetical protein